MTTTPRHLLGKVMGKRAAWNAALLATLVLVAGCAGQHPAGQTPPGGSPSCQAPFSIGYQIVPFSGSRKMAIWYPSTDPQTTFYYARNFSTTLALNGRPNTNCGRFPLIVFSHGLTGCGTQSIFFTETLARQGYVVAAPDHNDAICRVDGSIGFGKSGDNPSVFNPNAWTDSTYVDRKDDVERVITLLLAGNLSAIIDPGSIGLAGHSLGGYTALGVAGGWASWKDRRVKAALLLSPYSLPFSINHTLGNVQAPLMYQGADGDIGITPFLEGPKGAYQNSNAPKYFVKLRGGNHFTWTNFLCSGQKTVAGCIAANANARLINAYSFAFLNLYLKHQNSPLLTGNGAGLSSYAYQQ